MAKEQNFNPISKWVGKPSVEPEFEDWENHLVYGKYNPKIDEQIKKGVNSWANYQNQIRSRDRPMVGDVLQQSSGDRNNFFNSNAKYKICSNF